MIFPLAADQITNKKREDKEEKRKEMIRSETQQTSLLYNIFIYNKERERERDALLWCENVHTSIYIFN